MVVVNPTDPRNIAATWFGGPHVAAAIGVSKDAGKTWQQVLVPGLKACTGGGEGGRENATDPWLSFGSDGSLYLVTMNSNPIQPPLFRKRAIVVSRSDDGGLTWWYRPVTISPDTFVNDKPSITADPFRPKTVYVTWTHGADPAVGARFAIAFSRSDDRGETWSAPIVTNDDPTPAYQSGAVISVLPDGTLLNVFLLLPQGQEMAQRSTDGGRTWLPPVEIGTVGNSTANRSRHRQSQRTDRRFPLHRGCLRRHGLCRLDGYRDGTPCAEAGGLHHATVVSGRASDLSHRWGDLERARGAHGGRAGIRAQRGDIGRQGRHDLVRHRNDEPCVGPWTTDYWFARSNDGGQTFRETHVGGPFDLHGGASIPGFGCCAIGDYFGLAGHPERFRHHLRDDESPGPDRPLRRIFRPRPLTR